MSRKLGIALAGASMVVCAATPASAITYDFNFNQVYYVNCAFGARGCQSGSTVNGTSQNTFGQNAGTQGYYQGNGSGLATPSTPPFASLTDPSSAILNTVSGINLYVIDPTTGAFNTSEMLSSTNGTNEFIFSNGQQGPISGPATANGSYYGSQVAAMGVNGSLPYFRYVANGANQQFSLTSIDFESGPLTGSSILMQGLLNGVVVDSATIPLTSTLTTFLANWTDIDTVQFPNGFGYYNNVQIGDPVTTPTTSVFAALPLFAIGLGALGLLGWRRKRKARVSLLGVA